jgi:hypothetical protein
MRRTAWILLLVFVFAIPWEYSLDLGGPIGNVARVAGLLLIAAAVPAFLLAGRIRTPGVLQWLALAFFLWYCCSYFWTIDPQTTLTRLRGYFQVMMVIWMVWEFAESADDLRDLQRAYVAGSWVLALLTVADLVLPGASGNVRFVAEGQDPNDVARFLDLGLPMAALLLVRETRWGGKLLALGYFPLALLAVLLTASRGGFLAAMVALVGCGLLMIRSRARGVSAAIFCLPAIAAAVWFLVPHETLQRIATIPEQIHGGNLNYRFNIWSAGWQAFVHAPFFGSGAGSFVSAVRLAPDDTAHNTVLAILVEGGVFALMVFAAILVACTYLITQMRGTERLGLGTALLVWTVTSLVATIDESRTTWFLFALISLAGRLAVEFPEQEEYCISEILRESNSTAGEIA